MFCRKREGPCVFPLLPGLCRERGPKPRAGGLQPRGTAVVGRDTGPLTASVLGGST